MNVISGKGRESGLFSLLALYLRMKVLEKGVKRAGRVYHDKNKNFYFCSIHLSILTLLSISIASLGFILFFKR